MSAVITDGAALFARYADAPNALGYCGPPEGIGTTEAEIRASARRFSGVWPYLQVLARLTGTADPLDARLVEAYWLGRDLGVYTEPYDYFGYLQNELWRTIRLVVDTGLHSKGWTREQVIKYMLANSAESETQSTAEAERYMAVPGQALAYKMGELKIKQLRAKAEAELGPNFDIREFHAEVLKDGAVPLDVLEAKVDRWISAKRT